MEQFRLVNTDVTKRWSHGEISKNQDMVNSRLYSQVVTAAVPTLFGGNQLKCGAQITQTSFNPTVALIFEGPRGLKNHMGVAHVAHSPSLTRGRRLP